MITIGAVAEVVLTLWEHLDTIQLVRRGPLAQLVEQRPFKAWVTGSNPVWLNEPTPCTAGSFFYFWQLGQKWVDRCPIIIRSIVVEQRGQGRSVLLKTCKLVPFEPVFPPDAKFPSP